jgi:hypothetical protein
MYQFYSCFVLRREKEEGRGKREEEGRKGREKGKETYGERERDIREWERDLMGRHRRTWEEGTGWQERPTILP